MKIMQFIRKNNILMNKLLHHENVLRRALGRHKFFCGSECQDDILDIFLFGSQKKARDGIN